MSLGADEEKNGFKNCNNDHKKGVGAIKKMFLVPALNAVVGFYSWWCDSCEQNFVAFKFLCQ